MSMLSCRNVLVVIFLIGVMSTLALGCVGTTSTPPVTPTARPVATATPTMAPVRTMPPTATSTPAPPEPDPTAPSPPSDTVEPSVLWRTGGKGAYSALGGLDTDGTRVVAAAAYQGALVFDLAGNDLGILAPGEIGYVVDAKIGPEGTVYLADNAFHQVTRFDSEGTLLGAFGAAGTGEGEFGPEGPLALAVSEEGEVFALDPNQDEQGNPITRVQVFSLEGDFLRAFTVAPEFTVRALDVGPDGTLFAVSPDGYIAEYVPDDGRLIQRLGLTSLGGILPQAVAFDVQGNMVVTAQIPAAVALLDPLGQLVGWLGEETVRTEDGWPAGEFLFPFGVAVTPDGHTVIVGDTYESFAYITALRRP